MKYRREPSSHRKKGGQAIGKEGKEQLFNGTLSVLQNEKF
jgi:hypothetical protein